MKWIKFLCLFVFAFTIALPAQQDMTYQMPPKAITDLVDAPATPSVSISPLLDRMVLLERPSMPSIEDLAQEELRLAGLRINPATNGASRSSFFTGMVLKPVSEGKETRVSGLPAHAKIGSVTWSPDGKKIAFTNTVAEGIELWMVDVETTQARKLSDAVVNDIMRGNPYTWVSDSRYILYKSVLPDRGAVPQKPQVPAGPTIQVNEGKVAPARTYQDLLKNQYDESLFEYFGMAQLLLLDVESGQSGPFGQPGIIDNFDPSPDGQYVLVSTIHRPFSYLVPYGDFPQTVSLYNRNGQNVRTVAEIPLAEEVPTGFDAVRTGPRSFGWRSDAPAMLYWVEAQDGGDPKKDAAVRDKMYFLPAPFNGNPQEGIEFQLRYAGVQWGNDNLAIANERWWSNRRLITSRWQPANPESGKEIVFDRSYEDRYNDPGSFETRRNANGFTVLQTANQGKTLFLTGQGASPQGNRPFVDEFDLAAKKNKRLWQSEAPYYEVPVAIVDFAKGMVLTSRESPEKPPNYFLRNLRTGKLTQLTDFENPYSALKGISKELVKYKREDGIELTGTLYLPAGYNKEKDGPLPTLMWAYPREYKSADAASQVSGSPYQFIRPSWGSPLYFITQGYAIFDNFAMPILGEGDEEPNETFVKQLRMNAESAVNKLVSMGVSDPQRLGVGGHSYGAFMTANLLAHTDLFAAGIARSGAYNRTLTPFGFQAEGRTFWEAPEVYFEMSPFMYADEIKEPILLIHGQADNNSGTFPIQSERFYAALKGHGATARLVMLPHESHGYQARESVMHMMYEMNSWLEKHVKNRETQGKVIRP